MTTLDLKIFGLLQLEKKRRKFVEARLHGTVFSGHPTRTTFGNSMRMYYYTKYMMYSGNIKNYKIFVCGDDCLALVDFHDKGPLES
jgi:hypothetical protein